jgi:membrane associated rhomboid family serine protease
MNLIEDFKFQYKNGDVGLRLIFLNILFFAIPELVVTIGKILYVDIDYLKFVSLSTNFNDLAWKPWSLVSYAFFHYGIIHLIFNMLMLHFASKLFLSFFTQKQLLGVYILSAIFSGLIFLFGYNYITILSKVDTTMVGASGAIMALLIASVSYQPFMDVKLLIFGKVKLWQIALVLLFVDLIQLPMNNTGGHIAHLSGAFFGYIYIVLLQNGFDLSRMVSFVFGILGKKKATPFKKVHVNPRKPVVKRESRIVVKDKTQQQLDEILNKISQSGYDSLTAEEKEFLFKAGK